MCTFACMKVQTKSMALLVVVSLVGIFCYQTWWLVRLYHREMAEIHRQIENAMDLADNQETSLRVGELRSDGHLHGEISASASPFADTAYVESRTINDTGDSIHLELRRRQVRHEEKEKHDTLSFSKTTSTTWNHDLQDGESGLAELEVMVKYLHRSIRTGVNLFVEPSPQCFDSLFTARLWDSGLWLPHLIEVIDDHGQVTDSIVSDGFVPADGDEHYLYSVDNDTQAAYRLTHHPVKSIVLEQMTGILCASAAILLVLCMAFWYLIRTMLRMRTLDEMKTDFTNNITHELKTPIAVAYAANDALLNFGTPTDKEREYLGIAQQQLQRLSGMVEQILSMSMEQRKTLTLRLEEVDVGELVAQQVKMHQLKADKPVTFHIDIEPERLTLRADRMHLANMLGNLIDNAIKYSEGKADVTISCREGLVAVSDKGIGIAGERLPHIFERFYRVPQGNRHDVKGYGLGLYYVQQLMQRHGGRVEAESEPGKGTTIRLIWNE